MTKKEAVELKWSIESHNIKPLRIVVREEERGIYFDVKLRESQWIEVATIRPSSAFERLVQFSVDKFQHTLHWNNTHTTFWCYPKESVDA